MDKSKSFFGILIAFISIILCRLTLYPYFYSHNINNIIFYIFLCAIFVIIFGLTLFLLNYYKISLTQISDKYCIGLYIFFVVAGLVIVFLKEPKLEYYKSEYDLKRLFSFPFYLITIIICVTMSFVGIGCLKKNIKFLRVFFALTVSIIQGLVCLAPNYLNDFGGTIYHIHAYTSPILNCVRGIPFNDINVNIYGHYPIFFVIPLKVFNLFGINNILGIQIIISLLCAAAFLFTYLSLGRIIKRDGVFFVSVLSISYISFVNFCSGQYYQLLPHRIVFPSITLYLIIDLIEKKKRFLFVILSVELALALVWNFESGIVCSFSAVLVLFTYCRVENKKNIFASIILNILYFCILPILLALVVLNIWNILNQGNFLNLKDLIYPLFAEDFQIDELSLKLPDMFALYFAEVTIFISVISYLGYKLLKKQLNVRNLVLLFSAILGLGLMSYYFNRPAINNISICHIQFCVVSVLIINNIIEKRQSYRELFKTPIEIATFSTLVIILSSFARDSLVGIPFSINNRINTSWKMNDFNYLLDLIREDVPPDTPAIGVGVNEVYSSLSWDPKVYVGEWSDYEAYNKVKSYTPSVIQQYDSLFIDTYTGIYKTLDNSWIRVSRIGGEYNYYIRVKSPYDDRMSNILYYSESNDVSDSQFVDLIFLNYLGDYPDDDVKNEMLNLLKEEGRESFAYGVSSVLMEYNSAD